jgi:hypothetical protein
MFKRFAVAGACLAMSIGAAQVHAQSAAGGSTASARAEAITATGCLARQPVDAGAPEVSHENGSAGGLMLSKAHVADAAGRSGRAAPTSAVPGSSPSGSNTGTIGAGDAPVSSASGDTAYWIAGTHGPELVRYLGQRVEVTGTFAAPASQAATNAVSPPRTTGTSGVSRDGAPPSAGDDANASGRRPGARTQPESARVAHPSAPTQTITVTAFRVVGGGCL